VYFPATAETSAYERTRVAKEHLKKFEYVTRDVSN
jgi:hypothetical protein